MRKISLLAALAFAAPSHAADDLMTIYREALANDATFQAAKAAQIAGQERLPQGRALLLPSASLSAATQYNDVTSKNSLLASSPNPYNTNNYQFTVTQPIYRAQNWARYEQAKYAVQQTDAVFGTAMQEVILRAGQAYFDVLLAEINVNLAQAQKEAVAEQLAQARRSFEVGTATITDTYDAQARYDLIVAQEINALNDLEVARRALEVVIGRPARELLRVKEELPLVPPEPNDMNAWVEKALAQNPAVIAAQAAFNAAREAVNAARGGHYPNFDLVASYGQSRDHGSTNGVLERDAVIVGLQMNLPIYQGGSVSSQVREAVANQERARQELEAVQRRVALQVRQAFLGVTNGIAQVQALRQAVISNQSSLEATQLGLEVGVRTSVDLLNARQQLFLARRDLARAVYVYVMAKLQLEAAVGDLDEGDVALINDWLRRGQAGAQPG